MKKQNIINSLIYLYVFLPIMIFFIGWTRWFISIPGMLILVFCWNRMSKDNPVLDLPEWNRKQAETFAFAVLVIFLWVYLSGIGKLVFQNLDHECRNPIFDILVNNFWPATKDISLDSVIQTRGLIYYIGFWMPAAVVGKIFGLNAGYCFQALWAVCGIFIFYLLTCSVLKEVKLWPLIVFIFFSGLDILGYFLVNGTFENLSAISHIEWWTDFQFSSITTQLFWVFNQAVPAWVIFMLICRQKKNRYIVVLLGCTLLCSSLPFIGMLPFVLYFVFSRKYGDQKGKDHWKCWFFDTFTVENIVGGGFSGILAFLYLTGNEAGQNITSGSADYNKAYLFMYVIFIIIEAGCYYLAVYPYKKREPLFYISLIWLCICPWIKIGYANDFCMRASIPALIILYLMVAETLCHSWKDKNWLVFVCLMGLFLVGSVTPVHEIMRTTTMTMNAYRNGEAVSLEGQTEDYIFTDCNFSGTADDNFFFKYMGRK